MMAFSYTLRGDSVVITNKHYSESPVVIDRPNLLRAIEYTKRTKNFFATEQAYQDQLDKYEGALKFLDEAMDNDSIPDPSAD